MFTEEVNYRLIECITTGRTTSRGKLDRRVGYLVKLFTLRCRIGSERRDHTTILYVSKSAFANRSFKHMVLH